MKNNYNIVGNKVYIELNSEKYGQKFTIISLCDLEKVKSIDCMWHLAYNTGNKSFYVRTSIKRKHLILHRFIHGLDYGNKLVVDHINHDTLNNTRENTRVVTQRENVLNPKDRSRIKRDKFYKYDEDLGKYRVVITVRKLHLTTGSYDTEQEAYEASLIADRKYKDEQLFLKDYLIDLEKNYKKMSKTGYEMLKKIAINMFRD